MPYIKKADRPMFDTMIDGLVPRAQGLNRLNMGQIAGSVVINALTPATYMIGLGPIIDGIIKDLAKRIRVRGDANYCICRILLESMKPVSGWSYHSLSDVGVACNAAVDLVYTVQLEQGLKDAKMVDAISVLNDVATEIERRLLGPYEDKAILKNGDLACFNEDFALKPLRAYSGRATCGCVCDPCRCEPSDTVDSGPILDAFDLSVIKGDMPPITEALTQAQWDAVNLERRSNE